MRNQSIDLGCFPTGRHYPGIADLIADMIRNVPGLASEYAAGQNWQNIPLVAIDFETTGTDETTDRIIEIGLVGFENGRVTFTESLLVDPEMPVPAESRAVHGITDEELAGAPIFPTVLPHVLERLAGHLPVAYNAEFDRKFLFAEYRRALGSAHNEDDLPPALRESVVWIDPLVWAREILKDEKSRKLSDVASHFNVPLERAHRAAGDAEATGHIIYQLAEKMPRIYGELVRLQGRYAAFQDAELAHWARHKKG